MRELGAPLLERLVGELRAHTREAEIRWTAPGADALGWPK